VENRRNGGLEACFSLPIAQIDEIDEAEEGETAPPEPAKAAL
jgi:hypothetical protein